MSFDTSALLAPNALAGPSFLPPPAPQTHIDDTTGSSIQTPDFTDRLARAPLPPPPRFEDSISIIQTPNFTADRSVVSHISAFTPETRAQISSIQTPDTIPKLANSSISTTTSSSSAPRPKPRPRPAYKGKNAAAAVGTSPIASSSSAAAPNPGRSPLPNFATPGVPPTEPKGAPSHPSSTSSTTSSKAISGKGRVSDSGVEMTEMDLLYSQDIAERAKMRSRARTQANKAPASTTNPVEDVIELSSDDELVMPPPPKPKPKPKPKAKKPAAKSSPSKDASGSGGSKGKAMVVIPPLAKRMKTSHVPDPGFESDVNTIPVPTSDFPAPVHIPGMHSSQLPPSDPPPSTASSASARTHPHTSQEIAAPGLERDLSPLSSPPPPLPRKRKRPNVSTVQDSDDDGPLEPNAGTGLLQSKSKEPAAVPPLPSPSIVPETQPPAKAKPAPRRKRKDPLDDEDEEWGGDIPAKPSKSRKKARTADDDDFGAGGCGADESDEEWGASSGRAKGKKGAKKDPKKPAAPKKSRAKGKEKEKPPKSRAIVDDSADERDKEAMPPPPLPSPTTTIAAPDDSSADPPAVASASKNGSGPTSSGKKSGTKGKAKGKQRGVVLSDEDDDEVNAADISTNTISADPDTPAPKKAGRKSAGGQQSPDTETKENEVPNPSTASSSVTPAKQLTTPTPSARSNFSHSNRSYTIGAKATKHTPMSELIRRASAQPGSPFPASARPVYSPLVKASKSALRRIAPLHPHRRPPPPAPPRAPPPKKTKKMLELEEKWEMELEDSVEGWYAMSEQERAGLMRAKRDAEMGFYED
ncbi:hypothetical protein C2E23DRAFT_881928 [Lenzites betulinus]|nr:hypothetical protein C2E23DRAFT_881928 [Lenzites betulinus]